jgi:hypothetical protein
MVGPHGARSLLLLVLPLAAALRGIALSLMRAQPRWLPYYFCYAVGNYVGMARELVGRGRRGGAAAPAGGT